jgi:hypothetical protein
MLSKIFKPSGHTHKVAMMLISKNDVIFHTVKKDIHLVRPFL